MQGTVKWLCGKTGQIGSEEDVGSRTLCDNSKGNQPRPSSLTPSALPVVSVAVAWAGVGADESVASPDLSLILFQAAKLVVRLVEPEGLECCLS